MITTSVLYRTILQNPLHEKDFRVTIADHVYTNEIISLTTSGGMFDAPGIGNCTSRQIDLTFFPDETDPIPKQAEIFVEVRLVLGQTASEWIPKGHYFISTRQKNKVDGSLTITGFDAMLKAGVVWIDSTFDDEDWPMPQADAVIDIAQRMGVQIDPRTQLDNLFPVSYPIGDNGELTMMQVLEDIGFSNGGNWLITDEGKLRLVRFGELPEGPGYLIDENGNYILFGGDRIMFL